MDVIALLKTQHRTIEELFARIADSAGDEKQRLFRDVFDAIVAHDIVERELFYPACERALGGNVVSESVAEHGVVDFTLYRCEVERRESHFDVHLGVLEEALEHHVLLEEAELFPRVEGALDAAERLSLGERMERRYEAVLATDCQAALRGRLKDVLGESFSARLERSSDKKPASRRAGARFVR